MLNNRVHRVKGKKTFRCFRIFPYDEIADILLKDGEVFFEDSVEEPLKRQTVWKASRKLSELVCRKVVYEHRFLPLKNGGVMVGYLFRSES